MILGKVAGRTAVSTAMVEIGEHTLPVLGREITVNAIDLCPAAFLGNTASNAIGGIVFPSGMTSYGRSGTRFFIPVRIVGVHLFGIARTILSHVGVVTFTICGAGFTSRDSRRGSISLGILGHAWPAFSGVNRLAGLGLALAIELRDGFLDTANRTGSCIHSQSPCKKSRLIYGER